MDQPQAIREAPRNQARVVDPKGVGCERPWHIDGLEGKTTGHRSILPDSAEERNQEQSDESSGIHGSLR